MKDIKNYEGLYAITEDGNVYSYISKKYLKPGLNSSGYYQVNLCKEGKKKTFSIHRLVAEAFIPNPDNLPCVNHLDECKSNNCVDNLEWCSIEYNNAYGTRTEKAAKKRSIPVYCVELDRVFKSGREAAEELGLHRENISKCLKGRYKTTGGYHFRYAEVA